MKPALSFISALSIFICGCSIQINQDSFDNFKSELPVVKYRQVKEQALPYQFVETTVADIKQLSATGNTTIVYVLAAWCAPCVRKLPTDYALLDSLRKTNANTKLMVINNNYGDGEQIEKLYKNLKISEPIYVMSNEHYGSSMQSKVTKFVRELCDTCTVNTNGGIFILDNKAQLKAYSQTLAGMNFSSF